MKSAIRRTSVQGTSYRVWKDYIMRGTFAQNMITGEIKQISGSVYISKDLTVRKAIMYAFKLDSFRK